MLKRKPSPAMVVAFIALIFSMAGTGYATHVLRGPRGPAGPQGREGIAGPKGIQGPMGLPGFTGSSGPEGPAGAQGIPGDKGKQGEEGIAGLLFAGQWNSSTRYFAVSFGFEREARQYVEDAGDMWVCVPPPGPGFGYCPAAENVKHEKLSPKQEHEQLPPPYQWRAL